MFLVKNSNAIGVTMYIPLRWTRSVVSLCMLLLACTVPNRDGLGQTSPQSLNVVITPQVAIEMIRVPPGKISKKPPALAVSNSNQPAATDLLGSSMMIDVPSFFISSAEITFAQLVSVLDRVRIEGIQERIAKTSGKDPQNQYLRDAVQSSDMPAFALSFDDVLTFCSALTSQAQQQAENGSTSIESRRFRVPSHIEWQYACRAVSEPEKAAELPHFNRWIDLDAMPKETRAKVEEEWQKLGRPKSELTGSQLQIFQLLDERWPQADAHGVPQQILSDYFREAIGINRNFSVGSGRLRPGRKTLPNAWGLFDMHDNVCEWVIKIDNRDEFLALWQRLQTPSGRNSTDILSRQCLLLAGGGFSQAATDPGAWKNFAIWGGYPMNRENGELSPFPIEKGLDNSERSETADLYPGLRLVMDRMLSRNWFATIRRIANKQGSAAPFGRFRQSADEVATAEEAERVKAYASLYEGLALLREGQAMKGNQQLETSFSSLSKPHTTGPARSGGGLAALRQTMADQAPETGVSAKPNISDDELYFGLAAKTIK
jgi:formylglycine-generating enzyme required for sulfatase activity